MQDVSREIVTRQLWHLLAEFGAPNSPRSDDYAINHEVKLLNDDVDEFFHEVHKRFGTRLDGFNPNFYFPERLTESAWVYLRRSFGGNKLPPLRVGHMVDVIQRGAWFDPSGSP